MKVKDVIENMQDYDLEDEVVVLWWTKDNFENKDYLMRDDVWTKVVKEVEFNSLYIPCQAGTEQVYGALNKIEVEV
jgi:hypothetical protein